MQKSPEELAAKLKLTQNALYIACKELRKFECVVSYEDCPPRHENNNCKGCPYYARSTANWEAYCLAIAGDDNE